MKKMEKFNKKEKIVFVILIYILIQVALPVFYSFPVTNCNQIETGVYIAVQYNDAINHAVEFSGAYQYVPGPYNLFLPVTDLMLSHNGNIPLIRYNISISNGTKRFVGYGDKTPGCDFVVYKIEKN
jgi:hypothetical protein